MCYKTWAFDVFDVGVGDDEVYLNETARLWLPVVSTEELCQTRWATPDRCTMAVLEALAPFLVIKAVAACSLHLLFLLLYWAALREPRGLLRFSPVWLLKQCSAETGHAANVVFRVRLSCIDFHDKDFEVPCFFTVEKSFQRIAFWTEMGLAWGFVVP